MNKLLATPPCENINNSGEGFGRGPERNELVEPYSWLNSCPVPNGIRDFRPV